MKESEIRKMLLNSFGLQYPIFLCLMAVVLLSDMVQISAAPPYAVMRYIWLQNQANKLFREAKICWFSINDHYR